MPNCLTCTPTTTSCGTPSGRPAIPFRSGCGGEPHDLPLRSAAVIRSCWDYCSDSPAFIHYLRGLSLVTPVHNHADTVQWNADKNYLRDFSHAGCEIVPTLFTFSDLSGIDPAYDEVVVKPTTGNGGTSMWRVRRDEFSVDECLPRFGLRPLMVQPFLADIQTDGKFSVIFIDGKYSHAVHKRPAAGEYRVQHYFGGQYSRVVPDQSLLKAAGKANALVKDCLYARFDFIPHNGRYLLSEAELIEPLLHFDLCPEAATKMVRALELRHG